MRQKQLTSPISKSLDALQQPEPYAVNQLTWTTLQLFISPSTLNFNYNQQQAFWLSVTVAKGDSRICRNLLVIDL